MTKLVSLPALLLAAAILLPIDTAVAQEDVSASPAADAVAASEEPRFTDLADLLPTQLAGRPLADNLTLATGEQLLALMRPEE